MGSADLMRRSALPRSLTLLGSKKNFTMKLSPAIPTISPLQAQKNSTLLALRVTRATPHAIPIIDWPIRQVPELVNLSSFDIKAKYFVKSSEIYRYSNIVKIEHQAPDKIVKNSAYSRSSNRFLRYCYHVRWRVNEGLN